MRKWLAGIVLFGLVSICHAGTPVENLYMSQPPLSNTTILGSTATVAGGYGGSLKVSIVPPSINSAGGTYTCRNCFTKFFVQLSTNAVLNIVDMNAGVGTTDYVILGLGLGTTGVSTLALPEDHLGPMCFPAGDTTLINEVMTSAWASTGALNPQAISWEGYTNCGGTLNAGPMQ